MKVTASTGAPASTTGRTTPRASGGFSLAGATGAERAAATASAVGAGPVTDVGGLMALQGVEDATERRRRAIRRGSGLLDRLEELKLAMLGGEAGEAALERLSRAAREDRPDMPDPGLAAILDQIDLRTAVELAKAEIGRAGV